MDKLPEEEKEVVTMSLKRYNYLVLQDSILRRKEEWERKGPAITTAFTLELLKYVKGYRGQMNLTIEALNEDPAFGFTITLTGNNQVEILKKGGSNGF